VYLEHPSLRLSADFNMECNRARLIVCDGDLPFPAVELLVGSGPLENLFCRRTPLFPAGSARWNTSRFGHSYLPLTQSLISGRPVRVST
jgi:hypothetical protein